MAQAAPGGLAPTALAIPNAVQVDPFTGALSVSVPVEVTAGRNGFTPQLSLDYRSGSPNSAFGRGWSLSGLLNVSIYTTENLPRYDGADRFQLAGLGELTPYATPAGDMWEDRGAFRVLRYRARFERGFQRIERWQEKATSREHWRVRDARNTLTIFGQRIDDTSRICNPHEPDRVFSWLPDAQIGAHGDAILYQYAPESFQGVDASLPEESGRVRAGSAPPQRYLKRVSWGNLLAATADAVEPEGQRWAFQLVLDYGDHGADPKPEPDQAAPVRPDAFSSGAAGFELRLYRLCRRLLLFHDIQALDPKPVLVQSYVLEHDLRPQGAILKRIRRLGHRIDGGVITSRERPPLVFTYTEPAPAQAFLDAPDVTRDRLPLGFDAPRCRLIDLFGEGLPGLLIENPDAWSYRRNFGQGEFGDEFLVLERPAHSVAQATVQDFDGDGNVELVVQGSRHGGYYAFDRETGIWGGFTPFAETPHLDAVSSQWLDIDGDGLADLVLGDPDRLTWYPSLGRQGYAEARTVQPQEGASAAAPVALMRESGQLDYVFADMNGDGLLDQVLVRNGLVVYWPNFGQGRFGAPVVMSGAPMFAPEGEFDSGRLLFADLDGVGGADLIYVGAGEITVWTNASGNALLDGETLQGLPRIDCNAMLRILDFLGDGSLCLVWSQTTGSGSALQFLPLTGGQKPGLLTRLDNSLGLTHSAIYSTSAAHYLRDVRDGRQWRLKLPRHVIVVDRLEIVDEIGGASSAIDYRYHDGSFDGRERQFRGFGFVEMFDAEAHADGSLELTATTPSCTRQWSHLGAEGVSSYDLMWAGDAAAPALAPVMFEDGAVLSDDEAADALLALAGRPVRSEVFALRSDGTLASVPIKVDQSGYLIRRMQPALRDHKASFAGFERETLGSLYEQSAADPRVDHHFALEIDAFGATTLFADVAYPRRVGAAIADPAQAALEVTVNRLTMSHVDAPDRVDLATLVASEEFDVAGVAAPGVFAYADFKAKVAAALAAPATFDAIAPVAARRIARSRYLFWDAPGATALPLGQTAAPLRQHHVESAAYTDTLVASLYGGNVDAAKLRALGYVEDDGHCWRVGEVFAYGSAANFFRLESLSRFDGGSTAFAYDDASLTVVAITDALGNVVRSDYDYCLLAPRRVVDENGSVVETLYDPLGVAVAMTSYGSLFDGTQSRTYGFDPLSGFAFPAGAGPDSALADPAGHVQAIASVILYDVDRWTAKAEPPIVVSLVRKNLVHDSVGAQPTGGDVLVSVEYIDGFGRVLQSKARVEPGDAVARTANGAVSLGPDGQPLTAPATERWRVDGHTVFNRKQQPVRRYEPFYSGLSRFEPDAELAAFGAFHAYLYDALGRTIRHFEPNGTFSKAEYDSWQTRQFDGNDTVEDSTYKQTRSALSPTDPERRAYENAKPHYNTPVVADLDPSGRTVRITEADGLGGERVNKTSYAPDGKVASVTDPRGLVALTQSRDMLGRVANSVSMDAGEELALHDALDRPVESWSPRGAHVARSFDRLDRLTTVDLDGALDGAPLARRRVQQMIYGEDPSVANAKALNLLGRAVVMRDEAGTRTIEGCTPFGQIISSVQRVVSDPKTAVDWTDPAKVVLLPDDYRTSAIYDGLGRAVSQTLPDGSSHTLGYDRAGNLVEARISTADGLVKDLPVFQGAQFSARNQRVSATLGNGVALTHDFDPQTWRTRNIAARLTGASARTLLDVAYTYDPAGNIVYAVDGTQQPGAASPVVAGLATPAEKIFGYDALYQLRRAEGRAHKALLPDDCRTDPPNPGSVKGTRPLSLNDGGQIERYVEGYSYDLAGNLTKLVHTGVSASWTNDFWLSATSNRSLPAVDANNLPISTPEARFDAAGNALNFPHLRGLFWNWRNALASCVVIDRSGAGQPNDAEYYVSDADNRRVRKYSERMIAGGAVEVTDVLYLDGCEIKRILRGSSTILERRLTHCSDGFGRIAQIYRWAKDDNARETDTIGAAKVRYQINDYLGSAHLALDEAGKVIAYEEYLPFGQTALMAGDDAREVDLRCYRFCGKERDDSTGLYYFGQRYYAVWMCRWISPDPAGFVDGINLYAYCRNNPVTYFDPDGLQTAQRRGQERPVYGGVPLAAQDAWSALPADRREQLNQLRAQGNFAWFRDESTGQVHFGSRSEIRALVDAKLKAGENVGNLHAAPAGAKPGQPEGRSGGAGRKSPPKAPPRPPPPPDSPADAGDGTKAGSGSGAGDPAQGQDGSQGNAKGAGDQPGDSQGKGHSGDSGGNGANPGDGGGDGSTPGNGGTGGDGSGLGAKGTGKGGGGTSNKVGDGTGGGTGTGQGSGAGDGQGKGDRPTGTGQGHGQSGEGDRQGGGGTGASHAGAKDGEPGGHGQTPGGSGKVPGRNGEVPGGDETGTGVDPNGQPNGKDASPASSPDGQTATGDPQGARNDAGQGLGGNAPPNPNVNGHGSGAGKPGGHGQPGQQKGSGAKGEPQKKTAMDYVTQVAGYWNLEFHGDKGGASGGVPGGFGSHNWGGWGQAIYVALTVADVVLTFLSFGGLKGIKAGLTAGLAAAKKTIASIGKKAATLFTEEFWSKVFARGLRGGINWNPFKSRSLGNFLLSGKTGRFSTTGSYETFFKRIKTTTVDFLELESSNGGRIFASTDLVSLGHVDDLANQLLRSNGGKAIEIITGRHGARSGFDLLTKEFDFLLQDYAIAPGVKNLVIHDASKLSPTALKSILEGGNDIILAWCHSENSRWVMKALGLNFMHAPF